MRISDTRELCDFVLTHAAECNHVMWEPKELPTLYTTLHIMAKQRYKATGPLVLALERQEEAISWAFNSQDIANTLWAFATMGTLGQSRGSG